MKQAVLIGCQLLTSKIISRPLVAASRDKRKQKRKRKREESDAVVPRDDNLDTLALPITTLEDIPDVSEEVDAPVDFVIRDCNNDKPVEGCADIGPKSVHTDMTIKDISSIEHAMNDLSSRLWKMQIEASRLSKVGTKEWVNKDDKVLFYPGLP